MARHVPIAHDLREPARVARFLARFSIETTQPTAGEIETFAGLALPASAVFLTALAHRPAERQIEHAARLREAGYEPVPHIAARSLRSAEEAQEVVARAATLAQARAFLVIGGDRTATAGPYPDALSLIESGVFQQAGARRLFVAGYPDGHPAIARDILEQALDRKIAAIEAAGLEAEIVTQYGFAPAAAIAWLEALRGRGIGVPVRLGMAGPASLPTLLRFAFRCGVNAAWRGLLRQGHTGAKLADRDIPDAMLDRLAAALGASGLGPVTPHLFAFGGLVATARWIEQRRAGL